MEYFLLLSYFKNHILSPKFEHKHLMNPVHIYCKELITSLFPIIIKEFFPLKI